MFTIFRGVISRSGTGISSVKHMHELRSKKRVDEQAEVLHRNGAKIVRPQAHKRKNALMPDAARQAFSRRGRTKSGAKRAAILSGAKAVFLASGFEGANMDEVAARAGVSKMTVYRHFGSKEDLFAGVITELGNRIIEEDLERIFAERPEEALRRFARQMIDIVFNPETIELHRIVIAECHRFPKLGQFFYMSGPQVCILELLRGYGHLRVLLKINNTITHAEIETRIEAAVRHVFAAAS
jgi:TetR/AcrR family transcriptional repressor of mexJK operon